MRGDCKILCWRCYHIPPQLPQESDLQPSGCHFGRIGSSSTQRTIKTVSDNIRNDSTIVLVDPAEGLSTNELRVKVGLEGSGNTTGICPEIL